MQIIMGWKERITPFSRDGYNIVNFESSRETDVGFECSLLVDNEMPFRGGLFELLYPVHLPISKDEMEMFNLERCEEH
jgi:hypothetical protein